MPRNLLLADDSITIQKVIGITFAGEDFTIVAVDNGEDAVRKARELRPDVILADVVMPKKNGYEVCETIKNDPELSHIPVLLLAGTFEAFDESRARAARADGHIAKPFESQALINKVRELLQNDATQPAAERMASASAVADRSPQPSSTTTGPSTPIVNSGGPGSQPFVAPSRPLSPAPPVAPPLVRPAPPTSPFQGGAAVPERAAPSKNPPPFAQGAPPSGAVPRTAGETVRPVARASPPVLPRQAPGTALPSPPAPPSVPEVRASYAPAPFAKPSAPEASDATSSPDEFPGGPASETTGSGPGGPRAVAPERGGVGDLDWAALGFETDAAAESRTPLRGSEPARPAHPAAGMSSPAPSAFKREPVITPASPARTVPIPATTPVDVPPAPWQAPRQGGGAPPASIPALPQQAAAAVPLPRPELLPFGEPIDLADLEIEDPGAESPPSSSPQPGRGPSEADERTRVRAEVPGPESRVARGPEALSTRSEPSRDASRGDAGEARLREALSHASREVIEKIAWEVIPTLAETIIREHVERLVKEREK